MTNRASHGFSMAQWPIKIDIYTELHSMVIYLLMFTSDLEVGPPLFSPKKTVKATIKLVCM